MKTLPFNPPLGSNEEIALAILVFAPEKNFDREQAEYTLDNICRNRGYKLSENTKEDIYKLVQDHLDSIYN